MKMATKNGIQVKYITSNEAYDIYSISGLNTEKENGELIYHTELRNIGSTENYVLMQYVD